MSLIGGTAVFCVLGFLSKKLQIPINEVVQSGIFIDFFLSLGTNLAFVAYPEALSRMALSTFWAILFFLMILILGVSTQFGFAECVCTAFRDQFPILRRYPGFTAFAVCQILYLCGIIMCTRVCLF